MKNLILIVVICCFGQFVNAQTQNLFPPEAASNLKELGIKGPVKEIIEYSYSAKYGDDDTLKNRRKTVFEFDRQGDLLSEITYTPHGRITSKSLYDYTKKDTVTISQFDYNNKLANKLILKYTDEGLLIEADQYTPPIIVSTFRIIFKHNEIGDVIERNVYFSNNYIAAKNTFLYNKKNQKMEEDSKNSMESRPSKTVFKYDQSGNIIEEETTDKGDLSPTNEIKYTKHDKYGNWVFKVYVNDPEGKAAAVVIKALTEANLKATNEDFKNKQITTREIKYFDLIDKNSW